MVSAVKSLDNKAAAASQLCRSWANPSIVTPNQGHELFSFIPNINLFRFLFPVFCFPCGKLKLNSVFRAGTISHNIEPWK